MSDLKQQAGDLRKIASELEATAAPAPRSAAEIIQRFAPPTLNVRQHVDLEYAGYDKFDFRHYLVRSAGSQLGDAIASKLNYDLASGQGDIIYPRNGIVRQAVYTATVFVLTPHEMTALIERAMRAGRGI